MFNMHVIITKNGKYTFSAKVTSDGTTYAVSPEKTIKYKKRTPVLGNSTVLLPGAVIAAIIISMSLRKRRNI
jgi:hypothetical protein